MLADEDQLTAPTGIRDGNSRQVCVVNGSFQWDVWGISATYARHMVLG